MAESFENLDNILLDWEKDKGHKSLANRKAGRGKIKPFLLKKNNPEKSSRAESQSAVERD